MSLSQSLCVTVACSAHPVATSPLLCLRSFLSCNLASMAPKQAQSAEVGASLQDLLGRLAEQGREEEVLSVLRDAFGSAPSPSTQMPTTQAMTDASKRRRGYDDEWEEVLPQPATTAKAASTPPQASSSTMTSASSGQPTASYTNVNPAASVGAAGPMPQQGPIRPAEAAYVLPEGLGSLDEWGRTVCRLPKVASRHMTYAELAALARTDRGMHDYLSGFICRHRGSSANVADFKKYLMAINFLTWPVPAAPRRMENRVIKGENE